MKIFSLLKEWLHSHNIYFRRWWDGFLSYPHYLGHIKPYLFTDSEEEYIIRRKITSRIWKPQNLSLPVGKRVLSISPHPDDESIGAGGLLWAHRNLSEIHCIVLSRGEKGGALEIPSENSELYKSELAKVRKQEFLKTVSMLNTKSFYFFDFPNGDISCNTQEAERLRSSVKKIKPDVVMLPWFFDDWPDHRCANILYAWGCADFEYMVLSYEVWTMLEPNALFDITDYLEGKLSLIQNYGSQLRTVDYLSYVIALAKLRAFQYSPHRSGAIEAYFALPNHEYCELVRHYYGTPGNITNLTRRLLDKKTFL